MTLEILKERAIANGFKYAYGVFKKKTEPPHLVAILQGDNNFSADNIVYKKGNVCMLDYTFIEKDIERQNVIEDIILADVDWTKTEETYNSGGQFWQVSYFFNLK